jgi:site-specific recombinase XerD
MKTSPIQRQLNEYLNYCELVRVMSKQTMMSKKHILTHFSKECGVSDLQEFDNQKMNKWIASQVASGITGRTVNGRMNHVVTMIKYHREMGMIIPIKLPLVLKVPERPPRRKFYTREQIEKVLKVSNDIEWLLIRIKFDTGMRLSELTNLRLVNFNGHEVKYIGKGSKARKSFICEDTHKRLQEYCEEYKIDDFLWRSPASRKGLPYSTDEIRYIMRRPFYAVGYMDFYPHALRHSFGTDIQKNGATVAEAQQLLGHSKIETTERYLHGLDDKLEELFVKYKSFTPATV